MAATIEQRVRRIMIEFIEDPETPRRVRLRLIDHLVELECLRRGSHIQAGNEDGGAS